MGRRRRPHPAPGEKMRRAAGGPALLSLNDALLEHVLHFLMHPEQPGGACNAARQAGAAHTSQATALSEVVLLSRVCKRLAAIVRRPSPLWECLFVPSLVSQHIDSLCCCAHCTSCVREGCTEFLVPHQAEGLHPTRPLPLDACSRTASLLLLPPPWGAGWAGWRPR